MLLSNISLHWRLSQTLDRYEENINEQKLEEEMETYDDFIIGDFVDSYRNLTLKTLTSYTYFAEYCNPKITKWIVLNDDDTFVDQFELDQLLPKLPVDSG